MQEIVRQFTNKRKPLAEEQEKIIRTNKLCEPWKEHFYYLWRSEFQRQFFAVNRLILCEWNTLLKKRKRKIYLELLLHKKLPQSCFSDNTASFYIVCIFKNRYNKYWKNVCFLQDFGMFNRFGGLLLIKLKKLNERQIGYI